MQPCVQPWPPTVPITLAAQTYGRHALPECRPSAPPVTGRAQPPEVPAEGDRWRAVRDITGRLRGLRRAVPSAVPSRPPRVPAAERAAMLRRWE